MISKEQQHTIMVQVVLALLRLLDTFTSWIRLQWGMNLI